MLSQFLGFVAVSILIIVIPGPDLTLVLKNAALAGRRGAAATAIGIMTGNAALAAAAVSGLTALLAASAPLYLALRIAGAAYLIYLGISAIREFFAHRHSPRPATYNDTHVEPVARHDHSWRTAFRQGLLSNLLNPKVAAFYLSLFPQFDLTPLGALAQHTLLAATFWILALAWYSAVVTLLAKLEQLLQRTNTRRTISGLSGIALIGLGGALLARD
ncbi:LysE family translocator [Nocardia sp. BMG51109]|uniref:LysE family translocator n=1 Tax=Nocardia sp. BMG51109 TaxID=1056816 RepID=UPI00046725F3|nr:LysE family translocator [Nocardia sp. BMG51109]